MKSEIVPLCESFTFKSRDTNKMSLALNDDDDDDAQSQFLLVFLHEKLENAEY